MPYSEEHETLLGRPYIQHFDDDGSKIGTSEEREGLFGGTYIVHLDNDGAEIGRSEHRTGWLGDDYVQHFDAEGSKAGYSEDREGIFGDRYQQHYDEDGSKAGYSEDRETLFGNEYRHHEGGTPPGFQEEAEFYESEDDGPGVFEDPVANWALVVPWALLSFGLANLGLWLESGFGILLIILALPGLWAGALLALSVGIAIAVWAGMAVGAFYLLSSCVT